MVVGGWIIFTPLPDRSLCDEVCIAWEKVQDANAKERTTSQQMNQRGGQGAKAGRRWVVHRESGSLVAGGDPYRPGCVLKWEFSLTFSHTKRGDSAA